jgi:two-component system NarL family response regulator
MVSGDGEHDHCGLRNAPHDASRRLDAVAGYLDVHQAEVRALAHHELDTLIRVRCLPGNPKGVGLEQTPHRCPDQRLILDQNHGGPTHEVVMLEGILGASDGRPTVLLVDDHRLFREGLRDLLTERGFEVVGEAKNAAQALSMAARSRPSVALMDINMPGASGIEAARQLVKRCPGTQIVMLTVSPEAADVIESVQAGACGYLLKDASIEEIAAGIRAAADGESLLSPEVTADLLERVREAPAPRALPGAPRLTSRELEVLRLIAEGKPNPQISRQLGISEQTVKSHISNLLDKLGVENRVQAAVYAVRNGLI